MASYNENLVTLRDNYLQVLLTDSTSPQPSYSLDNKSVSRNEWREALLKQINELNSLINATAPYIIKTRQYT